MLFTGDLNMVPETIDVSIVIRTKNEEKRLGAVLDKIISQDYRGKYEIIIVDSGSWDKTAQIASGFPVRFYALDKKPFSYGYALNYGQKLAAGKIIVFLSAHCVPLDSAWLSNLTAALIENKQAAAVYGKQLPVKGVNPVEEFELGIFFPVEDAPKAVFSNANCAIRKEILQRHPFDEEITYGEDFLWWNKLPVGTGVVYATDAPVYHSHCGSLRYWAAHHERVGMASAYMQKVQGVNNFYRRKGSWLRQILTRLPYLAFFLKQGYFKAFFTFPALEVTRSIFYLKGLRKGSKKYAGRKAQG
jgi:glycosyltransferase involved in cell wall biosynthesis